MSEGRYELKYIIAEEDCPALLDLAAPHVSLDANARPMPSGRKGYVVSSVYLDDPELGGYTERLNMDRVRNRVRVRTYGARGQGAPVFLEAKRKLDDQVIKHRVKVSDAETWATLGDRPWQHVLEGLTRAQRAIADRFVAHVDGRNMVPVCTVRYEREIFVEGTSRLTLDRFVQGVSNPPAHDLYAPADLRLIPEGWVVLELKFNGQMPGWMRVLNRAMKLRAEPVSKFALGVGHALRADRPQEIRMITPPTIRRFQGAA